MSSALVAERSSAASGAAPPTKTSFIRRHTVLTYYLLTFAISWGGMLLLVFGRSGAASGQEQTDPLVYVAMLTGPLVAGILLTDLIGGHTGLHQLLSSATKWRIAPRWYAVALLTAPLLAMITLLGLLPASSEFLPAIVGSEDRVSLLLASVAVGLAAGIFEEIGWTGFAIPQLRLRYGVLITGLIVGVLWGLWHALLFFWTSGGFSGALSLGLFVPAMLFCEGVAPAFRVLMVWVYGRTGSVLITMLMHASLSGGVAMMVIPPTMAGLPLVMWYLLFTATLWAAVGVIAVANGGHLGPKPGSSTP